MSFDVREVSGGWDYGRLPDNVRIGRDCWIERPQSFDRFRSTRTPGLVLADRVQVYGWSVFNVEEHGVITVGEGSILVGAVFMCQQRVTIGQDVVVSYQVTIADSDFHPRDPVQRRRDAEASAPHGSPDRRPAVQTRAVSIDDGAWIGIGAIILKGVRIGAGARVGAGTVVARDVPAGAVAHGNPARIVQP